jgi:hypothetical protein
VTSCAHQFKGKGLLAMNKLIPVIVLLWPVAGLAELALGIGAQTCSDFVTMMTEWQALPEPDVADVAVNLGVRG